MSGSFVASVTVRKVNGQLSYDAEDILAAEEPLEIRLGYADKETRVQKAVSITMRTPGSDFELAIGFLYTEGILRSANEVASIKHCAGTDDNILLVELDDSVLPDVSKLDRHFYTTSSCGVCGKSSIESINTVCPIPFSTDELRIPSSLIYTLPDLLRGQQNMFEHTGGLHGCALFDTEGRLLLVREDVGRHNALDKLIGAALQKEMLPLGNHLLLLSGRASFELIQKAQMAGVKIVAAVGAPSSLAWQMAKEGSITLIGFLRDNRFNIYSGVERIIT